MRRIGWHCRRLLVSASSDAGPSFLGVKPIPFSFSPLLGAARPVGPWGCRRGFYRGVFCPSCRCRCRLLGADRRSPSLCYLFAIARRLPSAGSVVGSLRRDPYRFFGVELPSFRRSPLRDLASSFTPLGGGADTHYHIVKPKRAGHLGFPRLEPRSSLGTSARCMWLSKVCVGWPSVGAFDRCPGISKAIWRVFACINCDESMRAGQVAY